MVTGGVSARAADDARARLLLRRPRQIEKRHKHHHAQLHGDSRGKHCLGAMGSQPRLWHGQCLHWRFLTRRAERSSFGQRRKPRRRRPTVRHLPDDVRHHYAGPDYRGDGGAIQVHHLPRLPGRLGVTGVRAHCPLGVGRRLDRGRRRRSARLRGRHRRPHQRGDGGGGSGSATRQATRPRFGAWQCALRRHRRRTALVRLVRVQRGLRPRGRWYRCKRLPGYQHGSGHGRAYLGHPVADTEQEDERGGSRDGRDWWPRRHHAGGRLRWCHGRPGHRIRRGRVLLRSRPAPPQAGNRRRAGRLRGPWHRGYLGRPGDWYLRRCRDRRNEGTHRGQRRPDGYAGHRSARDHGLLLHSLADYPEGAGPGSACWR